MQKPAINQIGEGFETAVRVPGGAFRLAGGIFHLAHLIHHDERINIAGVEAGERDVQVYQLLERNRSERVYESFLLRKETISTALSSSSTTNSRRSRSTIHAAGPGANALALSPKSLVMYFPTHSTLYASPPSRLSAT